MSSGGYREALEQLARMRAGSWQELQGSALISHLARRSYEGSLTAGEQAAILGLNISQRDALAHETRLLERG
jgi:hypothetical protein